jgi:hypothetical protein
MSQPTGAAKAIVNIQDLSPPQVSRQGTIVAVQGVTEIGEIGKAIRVSSWADYRRHFGGFLDTPNLFPLYVRRALDTGGQLYVAPIGHYTDPDDPSTLQGTPASVLIGVVGVPETRATVQMTVTAVDTGADFVIGVNTPAPVALYTYTVQVGDNEPAAALAIANGINTGTGTHGYQATALGAVVTITAPVGSGAGANAFTLTVGVTGSNTATGGGSSFSGGVTAVAANNATFTAKGPQPGYNGIQVSVTAAASARPGFLDIVITRPGYPDLTEVYTDFPANPNVDDIAGLNASSYVVRIGTINAPIAPGTGTLSGGAYNPAAIVDADYIGSQTGETGLHVFNDLTDIAYIAVPDKASPNLDIAMVTYCESRKDVQAILRTPLGITPSAEIAYRRGTAPYSHAQIDSYFARFISRPEISTHPVTGQPLTLSAIGAAIGAHCVRNTPWAAFSGNEFGVVRGSLGVGTPNLGNAVNSNAGGPLDQQINAQLNPLIKRLLGSAATPKVVFWGNRTAQTEATLLQKTEVADVVIYLAKEIRRRVDVALFQPNDPTTWNNIYNNFIFPVLDDAVSRRGIREWVFEGDLEARNLPEDLKINTSADLDNGIWRSELYVVPVTSIEFILLNLNVTPSGLEININQ